jgi:hypothetical protein
MRPPWFTALFEEEDQVFFAQPTRAVLPVREGSPAHGMSVQSLEFRDAGVLRCAWCISYTLEPQGTFVPWEQCGGWPGRRRMGTCSVIPTR